MVKLGYVAGAAAVTFITLRALAFGLDGALPWPTALLFAAGPAIGVVMGANVALDLAREVLVRKGIVPGRRP